MEPRAFAKSAHHLDSLPRRLYEQAKDEGNWDPSQLDFATDKADWERLQGKQRLPVLALAVLCSNSLRVQWRNSTTLLMAIERRGTIRDSMCYSSLVFEKARLIEFYERLLEEVIPLVGDPKRFYQQHYHQFYSERLPHTIDELRSESDDRALIEALTLDGPLTSGVLAPTSLHLFRRTLDELDVLPATRTALERERRAAERQLEFSTFFIAKLLRDAPDLWEIVDRTMQACFEPVVGMVREFYDRYTKMVVPRAEVVTFAVEQFSGRYEQLEMVRKGQRGELNAPSPAKSLAARS